LYDGRIVNHAHNDYVEALAETGIAGGLCCALYLGLLLFHASQQLSGGNTSFSAALNLSGLVACSGFLVHSLVDFNLHLPANAQLFFLMATLASSTIIPMNGAATAPTRGRHHSRKR
jgi:O-antigen ligase